MTDKLYTNDHEWVSMESDDIAVVGISDFAQQELGDVVFVELPEVGDEFEAGDEMAVVESVKAAEDVKAPVSGAVVEVNEDLPDSPELVNESPEDYGWFCKIRLSQSTELDDLMSEVEYAQLAEQLSEDQGSLY